ncbi:MAG: YraN family protein [Cyclobacteriaceae bacterium]
MKTPAQHTGQGGEEAAAHYFSEQGYELLERNYRYGKAEIDLIVRKDKLLVFVEVKTRRNAAYGYPEEFVNRQQQRMIMRAAEQYIFKHNWQGNIRFDILAILTEPEWQIQHLPDAFY